MSITAKLADKVFKSAAPKDEQKDELKPPVKVGERFTYLGVDMLCVDNFSFEYAYPVVRAEYVNRNGVIKSITFLPREWRALTIEMSRVHG